MFHLLCPNIMSSGFGFSIYTPLENSLSLTRVPLCPQVLSILMEYTNKTVKDFTAFMTE